MNVDNILKNERKEYTVLESVYILSKPEKGIGINSKEISKHTGLLITEVEEILNRLCYIDKLIDSPTLNSGFMSNSVTKSKLLDYIRSKSALRHKYETNNYINMTNQYFNAPVGAVQNGNYNTTNVSQTIVSNNIEILQMVAELRQQINKLNQENQDIATDALDTLQSEVTNPTKTTKLKSALFTLWATSQGVASFVNAATAIADRFGIHFHN